MSFTLRAYSRALRDRMSAAPGSPDYLRLMAALWRRQSGKTTTLALIGIREMAASKGRLITYASASLLVGREVIEKEAALFQGILRDALTRLEAQKLTLTAEDDAGHDLLAAKPEDFASVFESRRMVVKLHHDATTYSRMQVIAPNPATARGFTGSVMIDECGLIPDFRGVWDAMIYIMSSNPSFKCLLATTPPIDDNHPTHELFLPPPGAEFGVDPAGHWYRSTAGLTIHRLDVHDGIAAGANLYHPETGGVITAAEDRALSLDKSSWDRNLALVFSASGTAAVSRLALERAQTHPLSMQCHAIDDGEEPPEDWMDALDTAAVTALGLDVATTDGAKSNYSSLSVAQKIGADSVFALVWRWKTRDAAFAIERIRAIVLSICRHTRQSPRSLCVDASSEVYFANLLKDALRDLVVTRLIVSGATLTVQGRPRNYKGHLGDLYTGALEDGHIVLPVSRWLHDDHRLVVKARGTYEAPVASDGCHADSFDGCKLAHYGLVSRAGSALPLYDPASARLGPNREVLCHYDDGGAGAFGFYQSANQGGYSL
jgi:hypothetical protein